MRMDIYWLDTPWRRRVISETLRTFSSRSYSLGAIDHLIDSVVAMYCRMLIKVFLPLSYNAKMPTLMAKTPG